MIIFYIFCEKSYKVFFYFLYMELKELKKLEKNLKKYFCEICDFECDQKCDWDRHISRKKHTTKCLGNTQELKKLEKTFFCETCNRLYKTSAGLWKHKNKNTCQISTISNKITETPIKNSLIDKDELIIELLKQNKELLEIVKNGTNNTSICTNNSNNNNTNSNNKAFNLNFFLNETCKNAMNITDFVDSIKIQLSDLMAVGELGYVEGISKIIVKNLNSLDETIRPIHCTDKKRETYYVKDKGQWEKEDDNKTRLKKFVQNVADKNIRLLPQYRAKFPDYNDSESIHSDEHSKIVIESMVCDKEKDEKIIRNISKATSINK